MEIIPLPKSIDNRSGKKEYSGRFGKLKEYVKIVRNIFRYSRRVKKVAKKNDCKMVWARTTKDVTICSIVSRYMSVPLIWDVGLSESNLAVANKILNAINAICASKIVLQSERQKRIMFGKFISSRIGERLKTIYPGITKDMEEKLSDKNTKEEKNIDILSVGSISKRKNQMMLVRVIEKIQKNLSNVRCVVLGQVKDRKYMERIEKEVNKMGINRNICFKGWSDEVHKFMKKSKILLHTSKGEGLPHVVRESMYAGLPVIATKVGGIPDVISDGNNGVLVDTNNVKKMAEEAFNILKDDKRRGRMSALSKKYAHENFSHKEWVKKYHSVIEKLLS